MGKIINVYEVPWAMNAFSRSCFIVAVKEAKTWRQRNTIEILITSCVNSWLFFELSGRMSRSQKTYSYEKYILIKMTRVYLNSVFVIRNFSWKQNMSALQWPCINTLKWKIHLCCLFNQGQIIQTLSMDVTWSF